MKRKKPSERKPNREFDEKEELATIERRYQYARDNLRLTVPRLRRNRMFMEVYDRLVQGGWKDWHVLLAIGNIVTNYRMQVSGDNTLPEHGLGEWHKRFESRFSRRESEEDPRPPAEEFTDESMTRALDLAIASMLRARGWQFKNPTPNLGAIRRFAAERYRYFELDVEHEPFFRGAE